MTMRRAGSWKGWAGALALTGLAASLSLAPAPTRAADAASLEARVQRLEDIEAIRTVLFDYGRYLDRRDYADYGALFAKDGEWIGGFPCGKGPAAIQACMDKTLGPASGTVWTSHHHLLTNVIIEVHGDTATAWSRWSFVAPSDKDTPVVLYSGHYDDQLVREDGRWKFQRRTVAADIPGPKKK